MNGEMIVTQRNIKFDFMNEGLFSRFRISIVPSETMGIDDSIYSSIVEVLPYPHNLRSY